MADEADFDVLIAGGGPAGCAAAITLARRDVRVLLLEALSYPRQKVCGEFVSAEALPVLAELLGPTYDALVVGTPAISEARLLRANRNAVIAPIHPAARSISRFALDATLWQAAVHAGADARQQVAVQHVAEDADTFIATTTAGEFRARHLIDASGRWPTLKPVSRPHGPRLIGLKAHARGEYSQGVTGLYFFRGGYCGVQNSTGGEINICALVDPNCARHLPEVLELHPELRARSRDWELLLPKLATAPAVPHRNAAECGGMLRAGDAAGFIDPFLGDGISLALRSGVLAAESISDPALYTARYRRQFERAFRFAAAGRTLLTSPAVGNAAWLLLARIPGLLGRTQQALR